ncbi:unnamed protein product [Closterium sp. Yama58-4]|nr:unnamed protein product [Closterium sp. Yama58-4]
MSSQRLVLGLPRVLPSLPPSLAPPCGPCVEGRLRATPHSSSLRPATEPFETLHLDVWGPASRLGPERERFFLVVVDDYSRYTTVFPLAKKSEVTSTLIRWLLTTEDTRGRRVSCLHSDRGGEFRSGVLAGFCREQGIRQSWTLPESPQQNGVAERRIGLVMEIARTSLTHARAPHFLWPYAVRYAAHQLNLWPRVSRPEASPTSLWTGSPGVASRFRVWGCLALVRDTSVDKLSPRGVPCVFLGFPEDSSDFTFYHPPSHRFFDSRDVRFEESTPYYVRYPCRGLPVPPPPLFLTFAPPPAPPVQPPPPGPAPSDVSHATPPPSVAPQVRSPSPQSSPQPAADPAGDGVRGEAAWGAGSRGVGVAVESVPVPGPSSGGVGVGAESVAARDSSLPGAGVGRVDPEGTTSGGAGAPSTGPGESGRVVAGGTGSGGDVSGALESHPGATAAPDTTPPAHPYPIWLQAHSSCLLPSPPESALAASLSTLVTDYYRTYRPVLSRVLASLVTDPRASVSSVSALTAAVTEFASTRRLDYATSLVADPTTSPLAVGGESALGCDALEDRQFELEFLAAAFPHLCAMLLAPEGDPDALDIPTPRTYAEAVSGPWASQWRAAMDAEMAFYRSTGTYVDETFAPTPKMTTLRVLLHVAAQRDYELHSLDFSTAFLQGSLHEEVWLRRPSAFTGTFPCGTQWRLRRLVYGLRQAPREWHDTLRSTLSDLGFEPSSADPSLFVRRGSTPFFVLVYVDDLVFATADRVALADVKSEL